MNTPVDFVALIWSQGRRQKFPLWILLGLFLNLVIAPIILASTQEPLTRGNAYALGLLALVILALAIYLFAVIFQPERF